MLNISNSKYTNKYSLFYFTKTMVHQIVATYVNKRQWKPKKSFKNWQPKDIGNIEYSVKDLSVP
jgi:hypothetical protein